ncbi:hypothetical protein N0V88_007780 [Collariella sp. IMI 366227]|nr:hypothetical protein N0V88_007780 [Collariella sp. IMI 366227]
MSFYTHPDAAAFKAFPGQDDGWDDSVDMQRSDSNSSTCTVDTISSSLSGYSSATDYSYVDPALLDLKDLAYIQTTSDPAPPGFSEPQDSDQLPYATGAQYQGGYNISQLQISEPPPPSDANHVSIEKAAQQATLAASRMVLGGQWFQDANLVWVPDNVVEGAIRWYQGKGAGEPVRLAVQEILRRQLRQLSLSNNMDPLYRVLQEAAYQLQRRLQGPNVLAICHAAIGAVLAELFTAPEPAITPGGSSKQVKSRKPKASA